MIDLIIATYNRPGTVCELVCDVLRRNIVCLNKIIVVDSSDETNEALAKMTNVVYRHSSHKNQPYQRFLGYQLATAEYLMYWDDDMQLLDATLFEKVEQVFSDESIHGVNLLFTNKNSFLENQRKQSNRGGGILMEAARCLTGRPTMKDGTFGWCGNRGKRVDGQMIEYFSGGAFAVRRKSIYKDFNFNLFTLFEEKKGMGEDVILAYSLSKQGLIYSLPQSYLFHNDTGNSTYTASNGAYQYRVAYSRYYLSREYARLNRRSMLTAYTYTLWHNLWRTLGLLETAVRNCRSLAGFWGYMCGTLAGWRLFFGKDRTSYWLKETDRDIQE